MEAIWDLIWRNWRKIKDAAVLAGAWTRTKANTCASGAAMALIAYTGGDTDKLDAYAVIVAIRGLYQGEPREC